MARASSPGSRERSTPSCASVCHWTGRGAHIINWGLTQAARERSPGMVVVAQQRRAEVLQGLSSQRSVLQKEIEKLASVSCGSAIQSLLVFGPVCVCRAELPEVLDLLLQLDHPELTADGQSMEVLELG